MTADLTIALAEVDVMRRDEKLQLLIDSIAFSDIPAALQYLQREEPTSALQDLQVLLVRKGAATQPRAAAAWVEQMPAGSLRSAALGGLGVVWANSDLAEAARWATQLPEGEDRENGLAQVAFEGARTQPIFALELTDKLAPTDARDELIRHAARQWASQDPASVVAWASDLSNSLLREQILADIAPAWGESDPTSAAEMALKSIGDGKLQQDALVGIAQNWVQKEPDRAAAWVLEFPESFQPTALENIVKLWAHQDLRQAEKWAHALPPGPHRAIALHALTTQ